MKRSFLLSFLIAVTVISISGSALAANTYEDTDTRIVDAKVVEVTENRVSVMARSGVEHVIAINRQNTKVTIDGVNVSLNNLHEGDVITIELDDEHPMKLAKNIQVIPGGAQVARTRR